MVQLDDSSEWGIVIRDESSPMSMPRDHLWWPINKWPWRSHHWRGTVPQPRQLEIVVWLLSHSSRYLQNLKIGPKLTSIEYQFTNGIFQTAIDPQIAALAVLEIEWYDNHPASVQVSTNGHYSVLYDVSVSNSTLNLRIVSHGQASAAYF